MTGQPGLNFTQDYKFRDVHQYQFLSQDYVNQFSDYLFFNTDEKLIFTHVGTGATPNIWCQYTIPIGEVCPILPVLPLFPMASLNQPLVLNITMNKDILNDVASSFADFALRLTLVT